MHRRNISQHKSTNQTRVKSVVNNKYSIISSSSIQYIERLASKRDEKEREREKKNIFCVVTVTQCHQT